MKLASGLCCLGLLVVSAIFSLALASNWPAIVPLHEKRTFAHPGENGGDTPFVTFINGANDKPLYKFDCHNGNYDGQSSITFSGDFQCAVFAVNGNVATSGNLLAANTKDELSTDWWNRGRMRSVQLQGVCLKYPEYSSVRHFRFRGILVTLRFVDVEWGSNPTTSKSVLSRFTIVLDAVPNEAAQTSRAEKAIGPSPPTSCYP